MHTGNWSFAKISKVEKWGKEHGVVQNVITLVQEIIIMHRIVGSCGLSLDIRYKNRGKGLWTKTKLS